MQKEGRKAKQFPVLVMGIKISTIFMLGAPGGGKYGSGEKIYR